VLAALTSMRLLATSSSTSTTRLLEAGLLPLPWRQPHHLLLLAWQRPRIVQLQPPLLRLL
jgi:hypothetical protein